MAYSAAFELALRSDSWHEVEHGCFFASSLLFWWPVIQPFPSVARWPGWSISPLSISWDDCRAAYWERSSRFVIVSSSHRDGFRTEDFPYVSLETSVRRRSCMGLRTFVYTVPAVILTVQFFLVKLRRVANETAIHLRKLAGQAYEPRRRKVV